MPLFQRLYASTTLLIAMAGLAIAQSNANCESFGVNLGNGGVYYFNLASIAPFSFNSGFTDCFGTTTPILQFPDGAQYTCTTISVAVDDVESVCPVQHGQLLAGIYTIFFPEIGFAREFTVVNTQSTVTSTQTVTATGTVTPVVTSTTIITNVVADTVTLPVRTTTLPAATKGTVTLSPKITITITKTTLRTSHTPTTVTTTSTITKSPPCTKRPSMKDVAAKSTPIPRIKRHIRREEEVQLGLVRRDPPDGGPTTTVTVFGSPSVILITAVASTLVTTSTMDVTSTETISPPPFTTFSGTVVDTITLPTKSVTKTINTVVTNTVTTTRTHTLKATITAAATSCS